MTGEETELVQSSLQSWTGIKEGRYRRAVPLQAFAMRCLKME